MSRSAEMESCGKGQGATDDSIVHLPANHHMEQPAGQPVHSQMTDIICFSCFSFFLFLLYLMQGGGGPTNKGNGGSAPGKY